MVSRAALLSAALLALAARPLFAADPTTPDQFLKALDDLEHKHTTQQADSFGAVIGELQAAAGDPSAAVALYKKAVFAIDYEGAQSDNVAFQKWALDQQALFLDPRFTKALQLQAHYIALSLERLQDGDALPLVDPLRDYLRQLWAYLETPPPPGTPMPDPTPGTDTGNNEHHRWHNNSQPNNSDGKGETPTASIPDTNPGAGFLRAPINEATVAKYFQIDTALASLKDWEKTPGNDLGILKSDILPPLRAKKDPRIVDAWDELIDHADAAAGKNVLADQKARFENETLPTLQWERAQDLAAIGRKDEAEKEMFALIKNYPLHPSNSSWITALRTLLKPPEATAPVAPIKAS